MPELRQAEKARGKVGVLKVERETLRELDAGELEQGSPGFASSGAPAIAEELIMPKFVVGSLPQFQGRQWHAFRRTRAPWQPVLVASLMLAATVAARAATLGVDASSAPRSGKCQRITDAVVAAQPGDTIHVSPGVYSRE